ncbi:MAG: SCP2 sterol-binding domain-containing protein [Polyangiales bacterium]
MTFRVNSIPEYFETIQKRFNSDAAKGVTATFMFELTGANGGTWTADIKDGTLTLLTGPVEKPTVHYTMDAGEYLKMANGDLDGTKAYMMRKLKVKGNLMTAQKFKAILPPGPG